MNYSKITMYSEALLEAKKHIGKGKMHYLSGPKDNGSHLFRVEMDNKVPDDVFFDFKLPTI